MLAIELHDIHKTFRIPHEAHTTLTERILSGFRGTTYERFEALRGVDLTIEAGGFVGIIGGNGSGKSTLLKIISGLLPPDRGTVQVDGSMSALLELGLGFSNELTVQENVELYAAVLGYPRREVARRVDDAITFAGLERFRDAKLKNLSTGMRARLGFATALQSESDIMLLDEILAVGDADFQLKCLDVFEQLKQKGKTIVLVSHDLGQVRRFCDEVVWLQNGRLELRGDPDVVTQRYLEAAIGTPAAPPLQEGRHRSGDGRVRVLRGWIENEAAVRSDRVRSGARVTLVVRAQVMQDCDQPVLAFSVHGANGDLLGTDNTNWQGQRTELLRAGQVIELRATFQASLRNGSYVAWVGITDRHLTAYHDLVEGVADFIVHGSTSRDGRADFGFQIAYRVADAEAADAAAAAALIQPSQQEGGMR